MLLKSPEPGSDILYDKILHGNCFEFFDLLGDQSIDMIFVDPPYNLTLGRKLYRPDFSHVKGVDQDWDQFQTSQDYEDFTQKWLKSCYRVLKDHGTIWIIGSYHNIYTIGYLLQKQGFWLLNDVIWRKTNPMPNFRGRRFTNAHETILWASKTKNTQYCFNYESLKQLNEGLQMRSDWYFPVCKGPERILTQEKKSLHPTQKPIELLYRILMASTSPGDIVLDPFAGTATTAVAAKMLGRHYICMEQEQKYVEAALTRLDQVPRIDDQEIDLLTPMTSERQQLNIPFGLLVEKGLLKIGQKLYSKKRTYSAKITADGRLSYRHKKGTIHTLGAKLANKETCNGWIFWYYEEEGSKNLRLIDELRQSFIVDFDELHLTKARL